MNYNKERECKWNKKKYQFTFQSLIGAIGVGCAMFTNEIKP